MHGPYVALAVIAVLALSVAVLLVDKKAAAQLPAPSLNDMQSSVDVAHDTFLPCAQPMTPGLKRLYALLLATILCAAVALNHYQPKGDLPPACGSDQRSQ